MFKRLLSVLKRKSFVGSIFFAVALWGYTSLNTEYRTLVKIPLKVKLPANRSIETAFPSSISVEVRGSGWHLFNLMFLNNAAECFIDVSDDELNDTPLEISRNDLLKGLQYMPNVQALTTLPERLIVRTGLVVEHNVPVASHVKIVPKDGFIMVGNPVITPEIIQIYGNEKILNNISSWNTRTYEREDVNKSFTDLVPLSDTLKNIVSLKQQFVTVSADIKQKSVVTVPNIQIKLRGGNIPEGHKLYPGYVNVVVQGGIDETSTLSIENIKAGIDFSDIANDSTGIIVPKISVPDNLKIIKVIPPYQHHRVLLGSEKELPLTEK